MAKTASLLISSAVVGTQYERDIRARITPSEVFTYFCAINYSKDLYLYSYAGLDDCFQGAAGKQEESIFGAQSSNKLFDDFICFYSLESMAYVPHALCAGLGS